MKRQIRSDMFELGIKFADMARQAKSAREAKTAFEMAVKAYDLCLKSGGESVMDFNLRFISGILDGESRSEVWNRYVVYCARNELTPTKKGDFFGVMKRLGFVPRKSSGVVRLHLIGEIAPELQNAREQLQAEFESGQKLIEDKSEPHELLEI